MYQPVLPSTDPVPSYINQYRFILTQYHQVSTSTNLYCFCLGTTDSCTVYPGSCFNFLQTGWSYLTALLALPACRLNKHNLNSEHSVQQDKSALSLNQAGENLPFDRKTPTSSPPRCIVTCSPTLGLANIWHTDNVNIFRKQFWKPLFTSPNPLVHLRTQVCPHVVLVVSQTNLGCYWTPSIKNSRTNLQLWPPLTSQGVASQSVLALVPQPRLSCCCLRPSFTFDFDTFFFFSAI